MEKMIIRECAYWKFPVQSRYEDGRGKVQLEYWLRQAEIYNITI